MINPPPMGRTKTVHAGDHLLELTAPTNGIVHVVRIGSRIKGGKWLRWTGEGHVQGSVHRNNFDHEARLWTYDVRQCFNGNRPGLWIAYNVRGFGTAVTMLANYGIWADLRQHYGRDEA